MIQAINHRTQPTIITGVGLNSTPSLDTSFPMGPSTVESPIFTNPIRADRPGDPPPPKPMSTEELRQLISSMEAGLDGISILTKSQRAFVENLIKDLKTLDKQKGLTQKAFAELFAKGDKDERLGVYDTANVARDIALSKLRKDPKNQTYEQQIDALDRFFHHYYAGTLKP